MKKIKISFLIFSSLFILVPVLKFDYKNEISAIEKRKLSEKPNLFSENHFNRNYFLEMNSYIEDRIGLKTEFKNLHEKLNDYYQVENDAEKGAFYGKDDWLFINDNNLLVNWQKANLYTKDELSYYTKIIKNMQNWLEKNGIKFIFYIAPNKYEIYGEFYPFQPRPEGVTKTEQLVEKLKSEGINVIYPKAHLLQKKEIEEFPIYYERDTHWNQLGAYYGSLPLISKITEFFPEYDFPKIDYAFSKTSRGGGDIEAILGASKKNMTDYDVTASVNEKTVGSFYRYVKQEPLFFSIQGNEKDFPKLIMFRDSFGNSLFQYIAPYFSYGEYLWRLPCENDKEYFLEQKPDLVIFEIVERHSPNVIRFTTFDND